MAARKRQPRPPRAPWPEPAARYQVRQLGSKWALLDTVLGRYSVRSRDRAQIERAAANLNEAAGQAKGGEA